MECSNVPNVPLIFVGQANCGRGWYRIIEGVAYVVLYFFIGNIRNIRNIVIKSMTYFCLLWNFLWNIRDITMEHYKNKTSAYTSCRKAAQRTGIDIVVIHYLISGPDNTTYINIREDVQ